METLPWSRVLRMLWTWCHKARRWYLLHMRSYRNRTQWQLNGRRHRRQEPDEKRVALHLHKVRYRLCCQCRNFDVLHPHRIDACLHQGREDADAADSDILGRNGEPSFRAELGHQLAPWDAHAQWGPVHTDGPEQDFSSSSSLHAIYRWDSQSQIEAEGCYNVIHWDIRCCLLDIRWHNCGGQWAVRERTWDWRGHPWG